MQGAKVRTQGAKVSATCVRTSYRFVEEMGALTQVALIAASCCAGPIRSLVVVVVVACCCCIPYRLALMLALTFAPCVLTFAPCTLTFAPCAYGVSLLSIGGTIPLAQMVVVTSCNLRWWCFILQPLAQIVHMVVHPLQLALVVLFHPPTGTNTALALRQLALYGGGLCGGSCICGSGGVW